MNILLMLIFLPKRKVAALVCSSFSAAMMEVTYLDIFDVYVDVWAALRQGHL